MKRQAVIDLCGIDPSVQYLDTKFTFLREPSAYPGFASFGHISVKLINPISD